jgi:hypothetical protein
LKKVADMICPQLVNLTVSSEEQDEDDLIEVTGRFHCPQLPPAHTHWLQIDHEAFETTYDLTKTTSEMALETFCEKRLCQLISQEYPEVEFFSAEWNLDNILNTFCFSVNRSKFDKITKLDFSQMNLSLFPLRILPFFPDLIEIDLRGNPLMLNLDDLKNYPNIKILSEQD